MRVHWLVFVAGLTACGSGSNDVAVIEVDTAVAIRDDVSDTTDVDTTTATTTAASTSVNVGVSTTTVSATTGSGSTVVPITPLSTPSSVIVTESSAPPATTTDTTPPPPAPTGPPTTPAAEVPTTAVPAVPPPPPSDPVGLRIEAEFPSGYNRDLFRHWVDADGDGCDTRREVLIAESLTPVTVGSGCSLSGGSWFSVYDNVSTTDASSFDIDHVVALKEAWDSGAWNWTAAQRQTFANDLSQPFFLIAVSASSNRSKSDRDPTDWLPTNTAYRCDYARNWIAVKRAWDLSVDPVEHSTLSQILTSC